MCNPLTVLDKIVEKISVAVINGVVRQFGYIFQYKKNLKKLEAEMKILEKQRGKVLGKVDEANTHGEIIEANVLDWKKDVEEMEQGFENFMNDKTAKENMQCFKFSCPDFLSRYSLSKKAKKMTGDVKILTPKGDFAEVSHPAPPPFERQFRSDEEYVSFNSRAPVFNSIMEALKDPKVNMIGVYGTGGVGKTKMVKEVGIQVRKDGLFDEVVMAVVSQDSNLSKIQGQLADSLNIKLQDAETEVGRANRLWNRLINGKKNLIILDDVWQQLNLEEIGIPITDGNKGCKVVLTSRNWNVWENMGIHRDFSIQVLSELEAWGLFKVKVGNSIESSELRSVAYAVCKECQGLPVAILAVGAALKGKKKHAWEDALDQMESSMLKNIVGIDPKLYSSLKLSYDCLESKDAQSCFLLCCLFPDDAEISIDDLVRHCMARRLLDQNPDTLEKARRRVLTLVDTLKTSCLLLDGTDENEYVVKMHDVIRDIAISIAKDDKGFLVKHGVEEWPEKGTYEHCSAISLRSKNIPGLPDELVCPQLHALLLDCSNPLLRVPDKFFSGMEKLTVLQLEGLCMLPLPSSLSNLANLSMLCLNRCKLSGIAILKDLKNSLEILSLWGSDFEELPREIGELTRLRLLDLRNCKQIKVIPPGVIFNLSRLEELYFLCEYPWGEKWAANLVRLTTLHFHIPDVMSWPKDLRFENLIRFTIFVGHAPYNYFSYHEKYSSTRILRLEDIPLKDEFNILLDRTEVLYLYRLKGLKKVLNDRDGEGFSDLKYLEVRGCDDLEHLLGKPKWLTRSHGPYSSGPSFNKLTVLKIEGCRLKYLFTPSCARGLLQLQLLEISECYIMEEIVGIEGEEDEEDPTNRVNFSQLKDMKLQRLPKLKSFYPKVEKTTTKEGNSSPHAQSFFNEKVAFPALENLEILEVSNITEIWEKIESFCQLNYVRVESCDRLVTVFPSYMLPQLQNLKCLTVYNCQSMEVIVLKKGEEDKEVANDNIMMLPQLRDLELHSLKNLKSFCTSTSEAPPLFEHQVSFPILEKLIISNVSNIIEIWDNKSLPTESFFQLIEVMVSSCEKLVTVFPSYMLPQLKNLKSLNVSMCQNMEVIVLEEGQQDKEVANDNIIIFRQLRNLRLANSDKLKSFCVSTSEATPLFTHQVALPALEELSIIDMQNLTEIWDKKLFQADSFFQLKDVTVWFCDKLVNVVPSNMLPRLQNLRNLSVCDCEKVEVIVSEKGEGDKEEANDNIIVFPQLSSLQLQQLQNLQSFCTSRSEAEPFFNHQVAFPTLEELIISDMQNLTEIWDKKLFQAESFFQLKDVKVQGCHKLVNVVPSNMLPLLQNLRDLSVCNCQKMEVIVSENGEGDKEEANDNIIAFPQLSRLELSQLQNLQSFCTSRSEAEPFFNHQVELPKLEKLVLRKCVNSREINLWHVLAGTPTVRPNGGEGQHVRPITELRMIELDGRPQLTCLWNMDPHGLPGLQNLTRLVIKNCSLLRNLFTPSIAMALERLEVLYLESCTMMEQVITATNEGGHKEVTDADDEIVFPKLEWLIIIDLPELASFCNVNYNFNFPSLRGVVVKRCPKMQTFTSGMVSMLHKFVGKHGNERIPLKDLNSYLEQQFQGKVYAMIDENDGSYYDGEERHYSDIRYPYIRFD